MSESEKAALDAFTAVPKLIEALLEFIMKMRDLTEKVLRSKIDALELELQDNKKLNSQEKAKLQTAITKLQDKINDLTEQNKGLREAIESGDLYKQMQRSEAQKILQIKNEMAKDPINGLGKNVWFDGKGDLTKSGAEMFCQKCIRENIGLELDKTKVKDIIKIAEEKASKQSLEVQFGDKSRSGISFGER